MPIPNPSARDQATNAKGDESEVQGWTTCIHTPSSLQGRQTAELLRVSEASPDALWQHGRMHGEGVWGEVSKLAGAVHTNGRMDGRGLHVHVAFACAWPMG